MRPIKKLLALAICSTFINTASAADTDQTEDTSAPTNAAQIQRAENLSLAVAENLASATQKAQQSVEISQLLVDEAQQAKDQAQAALDATNSEDTAAVLKASKNLDQTEQALSAALSGLASANQQLASISSVSPEEISKLRDSGLGWGEIAKQLGLHPKLLGLGHNKRREKKQNSTLDSVDPDDSQQSTSNKSREKNTANSNSNKSSSNGNSNKGSSSNNSGNNGNSGNSGGGNGGGKGNEK